MQNKVVLIYKAGFRIKRDGTILNSMGNKINGNSAHYYLTISTRIGGKKVFVGAHRLQAFQKYGYKMFKKGIEVRHLNGKSSDNSYKNIVIGTHQQNMMDVPRSKRISHAIRAASFNKKYPWEDVYNFHICSGRSYKKTMAKFGIKSKSSLTYIRRKFE